MSNNFKNDKFNGLIGGGFNYDRSKFGDTSDHSTQPWMDASVQYAFNGRNSISADFHHATWTLASSYRSTAVIQSNPLFSYTGIIIHFFRVWALSFSLKFPRKRYTIIFVNIS